MIPHLIRKEFLDLAWDAADLDAVAEFWLRLYEEAARAQGFGHTPVHDTEIRLRGFPRHDGEALLKELAERADYGDFPEGEIDRPDPDTLVISTGPVRGEETAPAGLGLPILAGGSFDGLMLELRFRVVGDEAKLVRKSPVESTLVLVGEVRDDTFFVRGMWRVGSHGWEDKLAWAGGWPEQDKWLAAFEEFRDTGEAPTGLAKKLFVNQGADRTGGLAVKLIHVPLDRPRLGGLLARAAFYVVVFGVLGLVGWWAAENRRWFFAVLTVMMGWPVAFLAYLFVRGELRLWFQGFRQFHAGYSQLYGEPVRHLPMTRAEGDARGDNPFVRKFTAELEAAGYRYAGDLRLTPELIGTALFRTFYAPDNASYVTVMFHTAGAETQDPRFFSWPASVSFLGHTFYADGGFATSVSGRAVGYRKKRTGPEHAARVFPDADDPVEFARLHCKAAKRFGEESGRRPVPHETFDRYVRRQEALSDEERRLFADDPYTWGDHLGWYLQKPRREYRG